MSIDPSRVNCPQCQARLKLVVAAPGETQTCPQCGATFVPPPAATATSTRANPDADWDDLFGPAPQSEPKGPSSPAVRPASAAPPKPPTPAKSATASIPPPASRPTPAAKPPTSAQPPTPPKASPTPSAGSDALGLIPFDDEPTPTATRNVIAGVSAAAEAPLSFADADEFQLAPPVSKPSAKTAELADRFTFGVTCPVCQSRMDSLSTDIGQTIKCPDCHSVFPVLPPRDTQLRTPVAQNPLATGAQTELAPNEASTEDREIRAQHTIKANAAALLAKAKTDQDEFEQRDRGSFEDPQAGNLFVFLIDPNLLARLAIFGLTGFFAVWMTRLAAPQLVEEGITAKGFIGIAASFSLCAWMIGLGAHCVALFRDSSYGNKTIEWPEFSPGDWLGSSLYPAVALIFSGLPGAVLGGVLWTTALPMHIAFFLVVLSWVVLFPLVFLSMMNEVSLGAIVSLRVYRSLSEFRGPWLLFYQASALLGLMFWGVTLVTFADTLFAIPLVTVGVLALSLMYFRLLGWLANQIASALSDRNDDKVAPQQAEPNQAIAPPTEPVKPQ